MADSVDEAQQYTKVFDDLAYIKHHTRARETPPASFDGIHCVDCDIEIPPKRIELAAAFRCVACQERTERR